MLYQVMLAWIHNFLTERTPVPIVLELVITVCQAPNILLVG